MYHSSAPPAVAYPSTSSISGIQGQLLEVTVVSGTKLKNTEWISRQDPYVCLEYGSTKFRTRTCTDGGKNPTFQEKFTISLIEGLRELKIVVWNSNTINFDDFIGTGNVRLQKVLSEGYDDSSWPLQSKSGRSSGEIRLILHYANAKKPAASYAPLAPPYLSQAAPYSTPQPPHVASYPLPGSGYPAPSPYPSHQPNSAAPYPNHQSTAYPPPSAYPPPPYPPPPAYPPSPYPESSSYNSPGPFPGIYRPPPY
ncbi:protein SRC2-like isoform X2 [Rhododendron vialii]|uniref:protein SRC2-like isoform X2 n=1 Tax=Rhododendron vialii TaxID=182163 RepID=UPI00265D6111|nr:protein SRC2-like isoform X2 [Rhododendron vialii]